MHAEPASPEHPITTVSAAAPRERIPELDGLRGIAVLSVVVFHYAAIFPQTTGRIPSFLGSVFAIGWSGVDLFFVLSGFLIGGILLDAKRSPRYFKTFYARRVYRIFPVYYLWVVTYFLLAFTVGRHLPSSAGVVQDTWKVMLVFVFFLQNTWKQGPAIDSVWLSPLWSLAVEEQFYLVIPWLIRFFSRRTLLFLLLIVIFLAPLSRILITLYLPHHREAPYHLTVCRSDALAMGVLLAVLWRDENWRGRILRRCRIVWGFGGLLFLCMIYLAAFSPSPNAFSTRAWGYSCIDLFYATLLLLTLAKAGGTWAAVCRWPVLRSLGTVSYCMYVIHYTVNLVSHGLLRVAFVGIATWSSLGATIVAAVLTWSIAKVSWRLFESPLIRRAHAFRY